jgi:tRNA pseudouridine38-40 synthase
VKIHVRGAAKMEHSTAIMEDAGKAINGKIEHQTPVNTAIPPDAESQSSQREETGDDRSSNNYSRRKRKGDFGDARMQHGSKRGGRNDNKRHKKGDLGRAEYL